MIIYRHKYASARRISVINASAIVYHFALNALFRHSSYSLSSRYALRYHI